MIPEEPQNKENIEVDTATRKKKIMSLTWGMFVFMLTTMLASTMFMWIIEKYGEDIPYWPLMTSQGIWSVATFLVSAFAGIAISEHRLCGSDLNWKVTHKWLFVLAVLVLAVQPLIEWGAYFNEMIYSWPSMEWMKAFDSDETSTLLKMLSFTPTSHFIAAILIMAILPAICEEFFFRGLVLRGLINTSMSKTGAIIASSLFFSLLHMEAQAIIPRFMLGALLGYIYIHTNSLILPIIAHAFNNVMTLMSIYMSEEPIEKLVTQPTDNPGPFLPIISLIITFFICEFIFVRGVVLKTIQEFIAEKEQQLKDEFDNSEDEKDDKEETEDKDETKKEQNN